MMSAITETFPFAGAFVDQWTSKEKVSVIAELIVKLIKKGAFGVYHVGGKRKTVFEYAKKVNVPGFREVKKFPECISCTASGWTTWIAGPYLYENEGEMAFKQRERVRADAESVVEAMREGLVLVATKQGDEGEQIIGCMQYKEISSAEGSASGQETSAYFGLFAVDQRLQRGGIGRDMVGLAEWIAEARGRDLMEIQVVDKSTHLLDWYGKLGYEEFARVDWDAPFLTKACQFVLMQKHL